MGIRVLVSGAFGRMGQFVTKAVASNPKLELAGQTGREYDLKQAIKDSRADVVVDFTLPEAVFKNTSAIIEAGARPVIGTTGLKPEEIKNLQQRCAELKLGGLIAPNFSLGGVLVMKAAREIAKYMQHVEIIEKHHEMKVDSPSGTAIRAAEMIAESLSAPNPNVKAAIETLPGSRGAMLKGIPIHALRLPGVLANLEIKFGGSGETVTLSHETIDRQCFMPGVMLACVKVMELQQLFYGLEHIL